MSAFWKYYLDANVYNLGLSFLVGSYAGMFWAIITYGSLGTLTGILCFVYFKKNEYYFYHNLGYTRTSLALKSWMVNLALSTLGLGAYLLINFFLE